MFTGTPIDARKRTRTIQVSGLPATQPSQPLRSMALNASLRNFQNEITASRKMLDKENIDIGDQDSLIPRSPKRQANGTISQYSLRGTPRPPRTHLLNDSESDEESDAAQEEESGDDEVDALEEEEDMSQEENDVEESEEEESEEDDDEEEEAEYHVPILPAHEISSDEENEEDLASYENEYSKIHQSPKITKRKPLRRRKSSFGGDLRANITNSIQYAVSKSFSIIFRTLRIILGPFLTRKLWWVIPFCLFAVLALTAVILVLYSAFTMVAYSAPTYKPENMDDLVSRLMSVERELASVSRLSSSLSVGMQDSVRDNADKFTQLENELSEAARGVAKISKELARLNNDHLDLGDRSENIVAELTKLQTGMEKLQVVVSSQAGDQTELFAITSEQNNTMAYHIATVKAIEKSIETLKGRIATLESAELGEQKALELVDKYLPSRLAVAIDPTSRKLAITPEFWQYLQSVLDKHYADHHQDNDEDDAAPSESERAGSPPPAPEVQWDEFLKLNEDAIKAIVRKQVQDAATVSKDHFKEMLEDKLAEQRQAVTQRLEQLDRKIELYGETAVDAAQRVEAPTQYALEQLVRKQIELHTTGTLVAKPDFADAKQGGTIDYAVTSPTYSHTRNRPVMYRLKRWILEGAGFGRMYVHGPEAAIDSDTSLGNCWPFHGHEGDLGIQLATECIPTDLAIYHANYQTTINYPSSPRNISLWAKVDNARELAMKGFDVKAGGRYVKLLSGQYNVKEAPGGMQVFHVPIAIQSLGIRTSKVLVSVESNWGYDEYTCLYRVRLFGDVPGQHRSLNHAPSVYDDPVHVEEGHEEASFGDDSDV